MTVEHAKPRDTASINVPYASQLLNYRIKAQFP